MEKNTTKNINEEKIWELKNTLTEYMVQANSPYNDGWTQEFYHQEAEKIRQQISQLNLLVE